ncbi:uncharacterized protein C4orf54 homolog [Betta splendens]|uniref:Uncharacterized protein C4orf54 homolog n=1 Tax=Betta splendens TaxID=158456 RepID=A0A9W2XGL1_BETSP|nr:uncharacterized protein C4orf54 homolog [Betta splendens]
MKTERSCEDGDRSLRTAPAPVMRDESKYVDVGLADSEEKRSCSGEVNRASVADDSDAGAPCATNARQVAVVVKESSSGPATSSGPQTPAKSGECAAAGDDDACVPTQPEATNPEGGGRDAAAGEEERGDHDHLSRKSESDDDEDDDVSLVLSDECVPCAVEDESHYITTHEIQLCELSDHEADCDPRGGSSASWDVEDNNQAYSFVDYAPFDGDGAAGVSTPLESDPCDASKRNSSDEGASRARQQRRPPQAQRGGGRQIHLSIRTTSRAINDPGSIHERGNILYHARRPGDMSRYVLRGVDGKTETLCDRAKCFIAAPGRLHVGKLRGRELTEGSSGESSAVSELDDADKEVRSLTARAFKSLAYPYLDAINFSTSSESSASERGVGINRWSTFVDLKYGNVNLSRGLDPNKRAPFEIAKNLENRINPPTSKIFTLNGAPHGAASSTKQLELLGQFGQGHGGLIRLTETLNFRCNVKSGMSGGERRGGIAQTPAGSRSTDEVTHALPSGQRRGASRNPPAKTMEGTQKKAIFASSLIKNVISKKMQFEQERKMERGEICEPRRGAPPCAAHAEGDGHGRKGSRELHRQSSRFSESGSDLAIVCLDDLGDVVDGGSCDGKSESESRRRGSVAPAAETNLEPSDEAGIDTKKGALEACRSTLLRSQNSAFRCWKDEELGFQTDHKSDQTPEEKPPAARDEDAEDEPRAAAGGKLTKMSHLFVPSIQLPPGDARDGRQLRDGPRSPRAGECGIRRPAEHTLHVAHSKSVTASKSPEIKINLRSVRDSKAEPFGVSKLRAPDIGRGAAARRADDFRCPALAAALKGEASDKVPHFLVRDIRDSKGKLQTPIHQVRDVRKLVKSSYHFVSLDNNENKSNAAFAENHSEQKKQAPSRNLDSVSPIVIQCQSVNTNNNGQPSGSSDLSGPELEPDRSSPEGAKSALPQRAAESAPVGASSTPADGDGGSKSSRKQEKLLDMADKKPESKVLNQVALEKLQAAVKTMEQLYVFEKNEWKRKNEPEPLTDSHVLSLLASGEHGGPEEDGARPPTDRAFSRDSYPGAARTPPAPGEPPAGAGADGVLRREDRDPVGVPQASSGRSDRLAAKSLQTSSRNTAGQSPKTGPNARPNLAAQATFGAQRSSKLPVSVKVGQARRGGREGADARAPDRRAEELSGPSGDGGNYLTIPVKCRDRAPLRSFSSTSPPAPGCSTRVQEDFSQTACSPEIPSAAIYHSLPLGISPSQPQVYCFSPAITPTPLDPFQATQRKMLLDPSTGNYYLVDTPVQPSTRRLFDPETGQYVDVPIPQPPMTPMPMPLSPLALSPGAYGHTYMIYPGFVPAPQVIPARALVHSQVSVQSEMESGEKPPAAQTEGLYMESPFYMATGRSSQAAPRAQQQAGAGRTPPGGAGAKRPVISITSQQGPRIIAPPSFDGTTMSFVVEHR